MKEKNEGVIEEILKERIEENKSLFNEKELKILNSNSNLIKKIYLLGIINARQIYGNN